LARRGFHRLQLSLEIGGPLVSCLHLHLRCSRLGVSASFIRTGIGSIVVLVSETVEFAIVFCFTRGFTPDQSVTRQYTQSKLY